MRLPRWMPWVEDVLRGSPSIAAVRTFEDAGITDPRFGHEITLHTGARIQMQWVRTSPPSGDLGDEAIVTGEPPARVTLPELPSSGKTPLRDVERHLVALIANAAAEGNPEVKSVEQKSTREDAGARPCCVIVRMHSGAEVFGAFRSLAPAGAGFSGGEHQRRKEVLGMNGVVVEANCPSCGQSTSAETGESVPAHQKPDGSREQCPGGTAQ